jgi:hypothetical protein
MAGIVNSVRLNVGRVVSEFGRGFIQAGNIFQLKVYDEGISCFTFTLTFLVPTAQNIQKIGDLVPRIGKDTFVAPNARVVGDPEIGSRCYVGYGTSIRGMLESIDF